ncbi:MAG: esterase [Fluviicola sp.]|nr:esterase [Fluviicola sp.]
MKFLIIAFTFLASAVFSQDIDSIGSQFYTDSIYSNALNEFRKMNIYLPEGYVEGNEYPVIYATDGNPISANYVNDYRLILDSLIKNELILPVIYVESFSNKKNAQALTVYLENGDSIYYTYRNFEYVEYRADESVDSILHLRFDQHLTYFTEELIPTIESRLLLPNKKRNRFFYGVSNGGGFGINMFFKKPDLISTYLCFSNYGSTLEKVIWDKKITYPTLYLEYGNLESPRIQNENEQIISKCNEYNLDCHINYYAGGHDYKIWTQQFSSVLVDIFGK